MIDLGDELDGYGEKEQSKPVDSRYLPKGGHVRLSDLQKTGFNVKPSSGSAIDWSPAINWKPVAPPWVKMTRPVDSWRYDD